MKQFRLIFTVALFLIVESSCSQRNNPGKASVLGVFVATTPCSQGTRPVPAIPVGADCEFIKWSLTLYQDESGKTPATYQLHCGYGLPKQGTTGFTGGGKEIEMEGKWSISKGTHSNPDAIVYRLEDDKTGKAVLLLRLNDDLLHLLDSDRRLMIGNGAWSYSLSRTGNK